MKPLKNVWPYGSHRFDHRFRLPTLRSRFIAELIDIFLTLLVELILIRLLCGSDAFIDFIGHLPKEVMNYIPGLRFVQFFQEWSEAYKSMKPQSSVADVFHAYNDVQKSEDIEATRIPHFIATLIWCLFEIYFVSHSVFDFGNGGCSIGKYLLNLRVMSCAQRVNLPGCVDISPASDPGYRRAFVRALVKNSGVSVWSSLIQISLTGDPVFSYDQLAGTVVVQLPELPEEHLD